MRPFCAAVLVALVALAPPSTGQPAPFAPGYVVRDGVRQSGEVERAVEHELARTVRFRTGPGAPAETLGPFEITAFGLDTGPEYRAGLYAVQPPDHPDPTMPAVRDGFARVVRDGTATLLAFEVRDGRPVFFVETAAGRVGLYDVETLQRRRPLYRQALLYALGGCAGPASAYAELPYTESAIAARVEAHNACHGEPATAAGVRPRRALAADVEVGLGYASGPFTRRYRPIYGGPESDPGLSAPAARIAVAVRPPTLGRVRLVAETSVTRGALRIGVVTSRADRIEHRDLYSVGLGARYLVLDGPVGLELGGGFVGGTVRTRVVDADSDVGAWDGSLLRVIPGKDVTSGGGQYAEVGLRARALPVTLAARFQRTVYASGAFYLPGAQAYDFKHESVEVGARWRF